MHHCGHCIKFPAPNSVAGSGLLVEEIVVTTTMVGAGAGSTVGSVNAGSRVDDATSDFVAVASVVALAVLSIASDSAVIARVALLAIVCTESGLDVVARFVALAVFCASSDSFLDRVVVDVG